MSTIESVLQEHRVFQPPASLVKQANISGMGAYEQMCREAEKDFEGFWAKHAREELLWSKPFTKILDESNAPFYKWFRDGELNASDNCLDRHLKTQPDKVAIIFEADDGKVTNVTYRVGEDAGRRQRRASTTSRATARAPTPTATSASWAASTTC